MPDQQPAHTFRIDVVRGTWPIEGVLSPADGPSATFVGWIGLGEAIEAVLRARPAAPPEDRVSGRTPPARP